MAQSHHGFFPSTSIEQNLTVTEAAIKEEEVAEQGLGNHQTKYQHLHTHTSQRLQTTVELPLQKDGSTVTISYPGEQRNGRTLIK